MQHTTPITKSEDIIHARIHIANMARDLGFGKSDQIRLATAVSEISRNILQHAEASGSLTIDTLAEGTRKGLHMTFSDTGKGTLPLPQLLADPDHKRPGAGLNSVQRIMDDFTFDTAPNQGCTVKMTLWLKPT